MKCVILMLIAAARLVQVIWAIADDEPKGDEAGPLAVLPLSEVVLQATRARKPTWTAHPPTPRRWTRCVAG